MVRRLDFRYHSRHKSSLAGIYYRLYKKTFDIYTRHIKTQLENLGSV